MQLPPGKHNKLNTAAAYTGTHLHQDSETLDEWNLTAIITGWCLGHCPTPCKISLRSSQLTEIIGHCNLSLYDIFHNGKESWTMILNPCKIWGLPQKSNQFLIGSCPTGQQNFTTINSGNPDPTSKQTNEGTYHVMQCFTSAVKWSDRVIKTHLYAEVDLFKVWGNALQKISKQSLWKLLADTLVNTPTTPVVQPQSLHLCT